MNSCAGSSAGVVKIQAPRSLSGVPDNTGVGTSQDSSYTTAVTGSLFPCHWPPVVVEPGFFLREDRFPFS
jgi:hypothetical protein